MRRNRRLWGYDMGVAPEMLKTLAHNGRQAAICLDQALNVLVCAVILPHEKSWADETFSSRCWRWRMAGKRGWPCRLVDALFFWDRDKESGKRHCELSFESEREGRQLPPEARG